MFGDTPLIHVDDASTLEQVVRDLADAPSIGVDTEADSLHSYREKVCLVQLSDTRCDYIIDPLKVEDMSALGRLMANPDQVKVLHGGDYDVVSLKRDFGYTFKNLFDTMLAAQFLGLPGIGLADLIGRYFGHRIDKKFQRHDWSRRPLKPEHLYYARGDTHFLPALREVLAVKLERVNLLDALAEECKLLEEREWSGPNDDETAFLRVKGSHLLDETGLRVLRAVWTYRDAQARQMDRPAFKVIPNRVLIDLAEHRPTAPQELYKVVRKGSALARRHADGLVAAVAAGLADTTPLPLAPRTRTQHPAGPPGKGPGVDKLIGPLKAWRNQVVERTGLSPVVVANNHLLKSVARMAPTTEAELAEVPGIRRWQVERWGRDLLAVIDQAIKEIEARPKKSRRRQRRRS